MTLEEMIAEMDRITDSLELAEHAGASYRVAVIQTARQDLEHLLSDSRSVS